MFLSEIEVSLDRYRFPRSVLGSLSLHFYRGNWTKIPGPITISAEKLERGTSTLEVSDPKIVTPMHFSFIFISEIEVYTSPFALPPKQFPSFLSLKSKSPWTGIDFRVVYLDPLFLHFYHGNWTKIPGPVTISAEKLERGTSILEVSCA